MGRSDRARARKALGIGHNVTRPGARTGRPMDVVCALPKVTEGSWGVCAWDV